MRISSHVHHSQKCCSQDEKEFVKQRDAPLPGQPWEKIARLCEFNPKGNKNTKDTSRMRSLLLQMKQGETKA